MQESGETPKIGPCMDFEFLIISSILKELEEIDGVEVNDIIIYIDAVKVVAEALSLRLPLPLRSNEEIQRLTRHCLHKSQETDKLLK